MSVTKRTDRCCNPFRHEFHLKKSALRHPSESALNKMPLLQKKDWLCSTCRHEIEKISLEPISHESDGVQTWPSFESLSQETLAIISQTSNLSASVTLPVINEALELLEHSPIPRKKTKQNTKWVVQKIETVASSLKRSLGVNDSSASTSTDNDLWEMIVPLKEKYHALLTSNEEKIQILTILPRSWKVSKIVDVMQTTRYMAKVAKNIANIQGVMTLPPKRRGKTLSAEVGLKVKEFYNDDEISALMPGMKDFVSVKDDAGNKVHVQKRLVLCNLKELYACFKEQNPEVDVGFSMFASLRPKHCVLAGDTSSTHTVCVCSLHQNMKLMIHACNLPHLTKEMDYPLQNYTDVLMMITCDDIRPDCYLGLCNECPKNEQLNELLWQVLTNNNVTEITYKQWVSKPRTTLETKVDPLQKFINEFYKQAESLLAHSFIAKEQSRFLKLKKNSLLDGECVVICDFAENYAFVVQEAAPGFHWNNNQASIYPVVIYYSSDGILDHKSLVIISDCMHHDAVTVYEYSKIVNEFVKTIVQNPSKIFYFSDGAPQQFKNYKNFVNIYYHEEDFGVPAEWHFFATAHGKGACDGVGGTIKRLAARASLQLPVDKQITTAIELYEWTYTNLKSITMKYYDKMNYEETKNYLTTERFDKAKTIKDTQKLHCIIPDASGNIITKRYSLSPIIVGCKIVK